MINTILDKELCNGCGLCVSCFPEKKGNILINQSGFNRPDFENKFDELEEKKFANICSGLKVPFNDISQENYDLLWGPIFSIQEGFSTNKNQRFKGASGGAISAIALYLLEEKKVDFVLHIGANHINPYINEIKISRNYEDIISNSGSRYSPSSPLKTLLELNERGEKFAVIAKPCDIVSIHNLRKIDKQSISNLAYTISFFCAGVPSIKGTEKVVSTLNLDPKDAKSIQYRGNGWPGYFTVTTETSEKQMSYNDSWGNILNRYLQKRCKICPEGIGEFADIACADSWDQEEGGYPSFQEKPGKSLIIARTNKGKEIVTEAEDKGYLQTDNFEIGKLSKIQPYQANRKSSFLIRSFAHFVIHGFTLETNNRWNFLRLTLNQNPLVTIKNFLGALKRF